MSLRSSINRSKQVSLWIWNGKFHLISLAAVIATVFYLAGLFNYYPNIVSAFMSITGLLIILALQILDAKQFAEHRPNTIRNWLMSFPTGKPIAVIFEGSGGAVVGGKAQIRVGISETATIERKVDFLLRQVDNLESSIGALDDRVDHLESSLKSQSKELRKDLNNLNATLKTEIAGHIVGSYDINLFAITITICGTLIQFFRA
jgi:tetrahydromethanopterin S-methyltransferase subunit B